MLFYAHKNYGKHIQVVGYGKVFYLMTKRLLL